MKLRQITQANIKGKLSTTLKSWLPILQTNIGELEDEFKKFTQENPYLEVKSGFEKELGKNLKREYYQKYSQMDKIESFSIEKKSLYQLLSEQICHPLFPTEKSQAIADRVVENINSEGYFEGNISELSKELNISESEFERVRLRFSYIEPYGVGAVDLLESFKFQLNQLDIDDKIYTLVIKMIDDFENMHKFKSEKLYKDALDVIRKFKNPPAIEYLQREQEVIPDIYVDITDGFIDVNLNDRYYPSIKLNIENEDTSLEFIKQKVKEAKDLVDALDMRKATLYKLGLMIVEHQYEFFTGGDIKPMKLKDLADDLEYNQSTISRAISNKYLECNRGVFLLKDFFSTALDEDLSNTSIKEYIKELVKSEDREKPMSDNRILELVQSKFSISLSRRTITKYRKQLEIPSSSERKKLYKIG